jgi:hypothetical protein
MPAGYPPARVKSRRLSELAAQSLPGGSQQSRPIKLAAGRADSECMDVTLPAKRTAAAIGTRPPARPEFVVRLPRTRALRRRTALGVLVVGPMALGTSVALLLMVVAAPTLSGRLFGAVVGAACTTATIWWLCTRLRVACTTGLLTIDHDRERIPVLGDADQMSNLTMLFTEPLAAPRLRRGGERLPPAVAALTALAVHVEDPRGVADALRDWSALGPLDPDDAALHVQSGRRGPLRRALVSRSERRGWILVACGVIVPPVALLAIVDAFVLVETRRRRACLLALAGFTVFAVRVGLALALGLGGAPSLVGLQVWESSPRGASDPSPDPPT